MRVERTLVFFPEVLLVILVLNRPVNRYLSQSAAYKAPSRGLGIAGPDSFWLCQSLP